MMFVAKQGALHPARYSSCPKGATPLARHLPATCSPSTGTCTAVQAALKWHRDALAEVHVLRYNILHAFLESAAHPHDVHGLPDLIPEVRPPGPR
jgi:hypothetical protein